MEHTIINQRQLKVFGVKFGLTEIGTIYTIKIRHFKFWEMLELSNFRSGFQRGDIFF